MRMVLELLSARSQTKEESEIQSLVSKPKDRCEFGTVLKVKGTKM